MIRDKQIRLRERIRSYGSCLVAYSGGVDSVLLALVAWQELGAKALAVIADSPSLARSELGEAQELANRFGFPLRMVKTQEFKNPSYTSNPENRCYFCKQELFQHLKPIAESEGYQVIAYGENASDLADFRPGAEAAREFEVRAPLREVGLTKDEIREISKELGLPTHEKPQMACLSSRIPHGEEVTPGKLSQIEQAELILRKAGFYDVRVRHHELKNGSLARIEIGRGEMAGLFEQDLWSRLGRQIKSLGYLHVTLDLLGYHRGGADRSTSESISFEDSGELPENFSPSAG